MPADQFLTLNVEGWTLRDFLRVRIEKAFLQDLETGEFKTVAFNPAELQESYSANYARMASPGLSYQRLQFVGNENTRIPLNLYFDQVFLDEERRRPVEGFRSPNRYAYKNPHVEAVNDVEDWRRFLISMVMPRRAKKLSSASPPPILFSWPGMIAMRVRVMQLRFRHLMFSSKRPYPRIFVAEVALEEDAGGRVYSSDVRRVGTMRPWASVDLE